MRVLLVLGYILRSIYVLTSVCRNGEVLTKSGTTIQISARRKQCAVYAPKMGCNFNFKRDGRHSAVASPCSSTWVCFSSRPVKKKKKNLCRCITAWTTAYESRSARHQNKIKQPCSVLPYQQRFEPRQVILEHGPWEEGQPRADGTFVRVRLVLGAVRYIWARREAVTGLSHFIHLAKISYKSM